MAPPLVAAQTSLCHASVASSVWCPSKLPTDERAKLNPPAPPRSLLPANRELGRRSRLSSFCSIYRTGAARPDPAQVPQSRATSRLGPRCLWPTGRINARELWEQMNTCSCLTPFLPAGTRQLHPVWQYFSYSLNTLPLQGMTVALPLAAPNKIVTTQRIVKTVETVCKYTFPLDALKGV
jgi:hypothetical protein